ncbi:MAG: oxygenase MpaB family protein [Byssovorax sp.]
MIVTQSQLERRIAEISAGVKDPRAGLFGPGSMTWRISRESIVFLGAGRAALLQLAHPYVAHGIEQHSATRADPVGRFNRTFLHVYGMIFGDLESAVTAARRVRKVHDRIHGVIDEDVGRYPRGHRYTAHDEPALLWVFATLTETSVMAYELGVGRLSAAEKDAYYQEIKLFAGLFGIAEAAMPPDWPAFKRYCEETMACDAVAVGRPARETARFLLTPPRGVLGPFMRSYAALTTGLLPPRLREAFGLAFGPAEEASFRRTLRAVELGWPLLPDRLRWVPDYVEARRRIEGRPRPDKLGRAVQQAILSSVKPRPPG